MTRWSNERPCSRSARSPRSTTRWHLRTSGPRSTATAFASSPTSSSARGMSPGMSEPFDHDAEQDGATPLTDDDAKGLSPSWVATRADLNLAERENILKARRSFRRHPQTELVLDEQFVRRLHALIFGDVWDWA